MNNISHLPLSEKTRRVGRTKARRGRPRTVVQEKGVREPAAVGTLTRTKSLLLAALRVWELKHRITDSLFRATISFFARKCCHPRGCRGALATGLQAPNSKLQPSEKLQ